MYLPDLEQNKKESAFKVVGTKIAEWVPVIGLLVIFYFIEKEHSYEIDRTAKLAFRWMVAVAILYWGYLSLIKVFYGKHGETMVEFLRRGSNQYPLDFQIHFPTVIFAIAFSISFIIFMINV